MNNKIKYIITSIGILLAVNYFILTATSEEINDFNTLLEASEKRLEDIKKIPKETPVEDLLKGLDDLEDSTVQSLDELDSLDIAREMLTKPLEDLTGAEMKDVSESMMNGEAESALDIKDDSLTIEAEASKDFQETLTKDDEALIDELVKNKELPAEEIDAIELANEEVKAQSNYEKIIESISDCILKNTR